MINPNNSASMTTLTRTCIIAERLVSLGLGTRKHGDYARPLPKTCAGLAAPWSPG